MRRALFVAGKVIDLLASILFILLVAFVILQVFVRYVLPISLPWTEELARYLFIYVTFLGAAIATRENEHVAITSLLEKFPQRARLVLRLTMNLMILGFSGYAVAGAFRMMALMWHTRAAALSWFTVGHMYVALPLGLSFLSLYTILQAIHILVELCATPGKNATSGRGRG